MKNSNYLNKSETFHTLNRFYNKMIVLLTKKIDNVFLVKGKIPCIELSTVTSNLNSIGKG